MKSFFLIASLIANTAFAQQTNIQVTNPVAKNVLMGNYNPLDFAQPFPVEDPSFIVGNMQANINADSLKASILKLASFRNRNSGSDTLSLTEGYGAARNWVLSKFQQYSTAGQNRLLPSFLTFDQTICTVTKHKNVLAVLPGSDTSNHEIILIEGHMDSRCDVLCDIACVAEGVEDNASGTALVMELARVLSKYTFKNTIVFMITTAEEQGLYGANAFALYAQANNLPIKAVYNNDVIGGVACGETSSAPSCPGLDDIDSTQVRLFSLGSINSPHKQLSRYIKLQYKEELLQHVSVPMLITIMSAEDRTGRGGDHIPFRQKGFTAMRFTSANEHGNASNGPGYTDRQHTSDDVLGVDTNNDQVIDSFFVDFNYLARNCAINGCATVAAAQGVRTPGFTATGIVDPILFRFTVAIENIAGITQNRIAIRSVSNDWDTVFQVSGNSKEIALPSIATSYYVSVAAVNSNGIESLFSTEKTINVGNVGLIEGHTFQGIALMQNRPNPFDESTFINVQAGPTMINKSAKIKVMDISGKEIERFDLILKEGANEVLYEHGYGKVGTFIYTLEMDGKIIDSKKMIFAN